MFYIPPLRAEYQVHRREDPLPVIGRVFQNLKRQIQQTLTDKISQVKGFDETTHDSANPEYKTLRTEISSTVILDNYEYLTEIVLTLTHPNVSFITIQACIPSYKKFLEGELYNLAQNVVSTNGDLAYCCDLALLLIKEYTKDLSKKVLEKEDNQLKNKLDKMSDLAQILLAPVRGQYSEPKQKKH